MAIQSPSTDCGTCATTNQLSKQGIAIDLIAFDAGQKNIMDKIQNKQTRLSDPEEKFRAKAYLLLELENKMVIRVLLAALGNQHTFDHLQIEVTVFNFNYTTIRETNTAMLKVALVRLLSGKH